MGYFYEVADALILFVGEDDLREDGGEFSERDAEFSIVVIHILIVKLLRIQNIPPPQASGRGTMKV